MSVLLLLFLFTSFSNEYIVEIKKSPKFPLTKDFWGIERKGKLILSLLYLSILNIHRMIMAYLKLNRLHGFQSHG